MKLGARLRALRLQRKMSVETLARSSRLSKGFISQVENGRSTPSLASLERITVALGAPLSALLGDTDVYSLPTVDAQPRVMRRVESDTGGPGVTLLFEGRNATYLAATLPDKLTLEGHLDRKAGLEGFAYVLKGSVAFKGAAGELALGPGDAVSWTGPETYQIESRSAGGSQLLLVLPAGCDPPVPLPLPSQVDAEEEPSDSTLAAEGPFRLVEMRARRRPRRRQ